MSNANASRNGGPVGLLLGYTFSGRFATASWLVEVLESFLIVRVDNHSQISLEEMISHLPLHGGHIKLAERFVNGALSLVRDSAM